MSTAILATKLYVPRLQPRVVLRSRLVARLDEGLQRGLTLISAPAGFGKTTLLGEWLAAVPRPAAWVSLDEGDSDPARFLAYLIAALRTVAADIGEDLLGALESPQPPPAGALLTALLNEIDATEDDFVLVLDDYHAIDSAAVDEAVAFVVEHLPPRMHLVIATREDPRLPLARLRARGQLSELRAADGSSRQALCGRQSRPSPSSSGSCRSVSGSPSGGSTHTRLFSSLTRQSRKRQESRALQGHRTTSTVWFRETHLAAPNQSRRESMKAMAYTKYGPPDVLELTELEKPTPKDDEVLLKVRAASVNPADWHLLRGEPYIARLQLGLRRPKAKVLGCDMAGRAEAVGKNVAMIRPGDEVFGSPFMHGFGAFAEFARVPEDLLAPKPATLSFEQAAAVPLAASTALQGLRDHGRIEAEQKVLIVGASGGVGTFAVQIAKYFDAEVTGVCSTRNVEMVRAQGADHVIDYTREDFTQSGQKYDLIFQLAGTRSPSDCRRTLTSRGTLVQISGDSNGRWIGPLDRIIKALVLSPFVSQRLASFTVKPNKEDLRFLGQLIESGKLTPVIDRKYSLSETAGAIRYLENGHARGKVVITVPGEGA